MLKPEDINVNNCLPRGRQRGCGTPRATPFIGLFKSGPDSLTDCGAETKTVRLHWDLTGGGGGTFMVESAIIYTLGNSWSLGNIYSTKPLLS